MAALARLVHLTRAIVVAALASACGGDDVASPLAPSGRPAVLQPGTYDLSLAGVSCSGPSALSATSATVRSGVTRDGGAWVVRPASSAGGDFVIRLSEGPAAFDLISVTGVYTGTAIDPQGFGGSDPLVVTATSATGGELPLTGSLKTTTPAFAFETLAVGAGTGRFVLSASNGAVTCAAFVWGIRPPLTP
jgi:hypothetical protein